MRSKSSVRDRARRRFLLDASELAVLCAFAVAQPLFDLLGRKPEFFAVRRSEPLDLWLLVILAILATPLPLILIELCARAVHKPLQRALHSFFCALLIAAILLPPIHRNLALEPWSELSAALVAGIIGAFALYRWRAIQQLIIFLIPVLVVFPIIFLIQPGVSKILRPEEVEAFEPTRATTPIVLLIFDELPMTSLLAETHTIDAKLYPNFAALAEQATWYRHAVTASDFTVLSVPAILSGRLPEEALLPLAPDYPHSLFTMLGDRYAMNVSESVTQLCPKTLCVDRGAEGALARLRALFSDLGVLYLHILLPEAWTTHLPPVTQNWMLFKNRDDWASDWRRRGKGDRTAQIERFLSGIHATEEPVLHLLHVLLPHAPFDFLPSGKRYSNRGDVVGLEKDILPDDEWAVTQIHQRHLLQVGFVDRILGQVMARLKQVGLWDRAVMAVTADHGASFRAGIHYRQVTHRNFAEILPVPLWIKAPGQQNGRLDLRPMSLIDVLPTIAELAGAELPWPVDGISFADPAVPGRQLLPVARQRRPKPNRFEVSRSDIEPGELAVLADLDQRFGAAESGRELFKPARREGWIGREVTDLALGEPTPYKVRLTWPVSALDVEPTGSFVPAHLTGDLVGAPVSEPVDLAIAVNGRIAAVTASWTFKPSRFSAIVDPAVFRQGVNRVEVMALTPASTPDLPPIPRPVPPETRSSIFGIEERGLYGVEVWQEGPIRWTDGNAEVTVPINRLRPPHGFRLTLIGGHPKGTRLRIKVDGVGLLDTWFEPLKQGAQWSRDLNLETVATGDRLRLEIVSEPFVPAEVFQGSTDERRLGVAISGFELLDASRKDHEAR